ncbi:MAG TPA: 4-(cytidine 5'-diphospho)-2-C-methyl-D-erythritol kinase [Pyrinomonadaceae bacterium]|nr:4-(cytidine 5'-diphospho)-2-C-methyl-D-erythritol kinase [Pyrinomonadaceae bacterium]
MITTPFTFPSFAKINWILRILGKRPDGYHEVVTVLQTISLKDELTIQLSENGPIKLTCDDPTIPTDNSNLIIKATQLLSECRQDWFGASIHLSKRIPAQGGLGGGSSNAAVALLAINELWKASSVSVEELLDPSDLGADVPFFLMGGRCAATGIGEVLRPLPDAPKQYLIVITPNAKVSTAHAYAALNAPSLTTFDYVSILSSSLADLNSADSRQWPLRNDFERVIFEIEPEIERVKNALLDAGAWGALLAGSGSSVFGVFDSEAARDRGLENLRCEAGWRVFPCETISREEYVRAMNSSGIPLFTLS